MTPILVLVAILLCCFYSITFIRLWRFVIETFGFTAMGTSAWLPIILAKRHLLAQNFKEDFLLIFIFTFLLSLFYSCVLEIAYFLGIRKGSHWTTGLSCCLALLIAKGTIIFMGFIQMEKLTTWETRYLIASSGVVGIIIAIAISRIDASVKIKTALEKIDIPGTPRNYY